jgi:small-conductance mechanosensitive channel
MGGVPEAPMVEQFLGEYVWILLVGFTALIFKSTIESIIAGLFVFLSNDYNEDDVVIVNGDMGRIVRVSPWSTTFYIYEVFEGRIIGGRKLVVANTELKTLRIVKPLSKLDLSEGDK